VAVGPVNRANLPDAVRSKSNSESCVAGDGTRFLLPCESGLGRLQLGGTFETRFFADIRLFRPDVCRKESRIQDQVSVRPE
jgi:hypothetical protein